MTRPILVPAGYEELLRDLKTRIRAAQVKAVSAVNRELIALYWEIGKSIVEQQEKAAWGKAVVENLARDLRREFPDMTGFSARNLWDMRRFYEAYAAQPILRQLVAEIPWGHNLLLLNAVKDAAQREWYAAQIVENGWSRAVLQHHLDTDLYARQVEAGKTTNFARTLPPPQSDLAQQMMKDSYVFDFLTLDQQARERDLERALVEKIRAFLLELGAGFAFMGSQYHLEVGGQDFYVDLLFYHHRLRCLVALDLKMEEFQPSFAGQMNFYLAALDDMVRHPDDAPSVGMILCRSKNNIVVEYALRDSSKPIGVAEYRYTTSPPANLQQALPAPHEFEQLLHPPGQQIGQGESEEEA
jgi:predicted nuclease of restriction endonuclease-like (RecB) superfamily